MIKQILIITCVVSTLAALTGCDNSVGKRETITEVLSFNNINEISVDVSSAEVIIIPEDRNDILIEFDTYENGDKLRTKEGKNTLIETYNDKTISLSMNTDYKLRIHLPKEYDNDMVFDLSSGSITMSDLKLKDLTYDLSSGNINATNISSDELKVEVSSGTVKLDQVTTKIIHIDMSSGDVSLNDFSGEIKGSSSSGTFSVSYLETMDALDFEASSGNININYSDVDIDGDFKLTKSSGSINVGIDLDNYNSSDDGDKITGSLGSGEYPVTLDISSGSIKIK